jgi:hypothetical protein
MPPDKKIINNDKLPIAYNPLVMGDKKLFGLSFPRSVKRESETRELDPRSKGCGDDTLKQLLQPVMNGYKLSINEMLQILYMW